MSYERECPLMRLFSTPKWFFKAKNYLLLGHIYWKINKLAGSDPERREARFEYKDLLGCRSFTVRGRTSLIIDAPAVRTCDQSAVPASIISARAAIAYASMIVTPRDARAGTTTSAGTAPTTACCQKREEY
jgi:hypothetical protein